MGNGDQWLEEQDKKKLRDPYIFKPAEEFFAEIEEPNSGTKQPSKVICTDEDQLLADGRPNPACSHGRVFHFDDSALLLVQFLRPKVWRVRFDPSNKSGADFTDYNSRTIVQDTTTNLINVLDTVEELQWAVELVQDSRYYILQSVVNPATDKRSIQVQLWIQRDPFQITAVRVLQNELPAQNLPEPQSMEAETIEKVKLETARGTQGATIWRTRPRGLRYTDRATVLEIEKSVTADFMGFGEQGGRNLFKKKTFMNYFNFDNMRYQNVYAQGPLDDREPLYHSEPYWIEVDAVPGYRSQLATFIDNYSHICLDLGVTNQNAVRVATRFNSFHGIFVAGDSVQEVIQLYTSIVGKPRLKPRYVLGYHQGCYGYDTQEMVLDAVDQYRRVNFPIDGMHVDVDVQDDYRTFTIDTRQGHFPDPKAMFQQLREKGVKCSTNITPYINSERSSYDTGMNGGYTTLNEGLQNGCFVVDKRDIDPTVPESWNQRYLQYSVGNRYFGRPFSDRPPYFEADNYSFTDAFNSGKPFHGGVFYGWGNGHPGHYPNLNNKDVRMWWGRQYKYLYECGLDFVWQDMTSPCIAEQFGDMKSLPFRLLLDSDGWSGDPDREKQKKAIEIWSLYSYNLHKATYHGINHLHSVSPSLKWRENRRNFIIGRGSFVGSHRYAGLWTGDNASTWEFLDISVAQVLSLGLSGVTISGADVGGFEFVDSEHNFANPELIIRWYCAYSLLPWFRNHYTKKRMWNDGPRKGEMRKDGKLFQEPYEYQWYYDNNKWNMNDKEKTIYGAVLPVCRYYIRLRYSLMQLLYDAMFENMVTGLPIARAMPITDDRDRSLFSDENQHFTRNQYMVRNDLLVAPALVPESQEPARTLYLPYPDAWYPMNLRPDDPIGAPLSEKVEGGSRVKYSCLISDQEPQLPYVTPMYIREGAIIPKIQARDYIPDPSLPKQPPNPITLHVYPGKENTYDMYLDDGISRDSAPKLHVMEPAVVSNVAFGTLHKLDGIGDEKAADKYCHVSVHQKTVTIGDGDGPVKHLQRLTIRSPFNGYGDLSDLFGNKYTIIFWHDPVTPIRSVQVSSSTKGVESSSDEGHRATIATLAVADAHTEQGVTIELTHDG